MPGHDHHPRTIAIETQLEGLRTVIALSGELDVSGVPTLEEALLRQEATGRDIALDLGALTYIDSAGMTVLFQSAQRARRAGRTLTVVAVGQRVAGLLELTGLDAVLGLDLIEPEGRPS